MFLSPEDLQALTGYVRPSAQRRWLLHNGVRFEVARDGRPVVLRSVIESRLSGKQRNAPTEPDFSVLEIN